MLYKQRMYCEECGFYIFFENTDAPNPNEDCPLDSNHTVRDHKILSSEGDEGFYLSAENEINTEETDWQDIILAPVTPIEETDYLLKFCCEVFNSNNNAVTCVRVIVDDVEKILSNVDCEVDGGIKLERLISGFIKTTLDVSTHLIKIQYKCRSGTAFIRRVRLHGIPVAYSEGAGYGYGSS